MPIGFPVGSALNKCFSPATASRLRRGGSQRSNFASDALAAGVGIHALARIMGTSIEMIERHYGTLLDGALESIAGRLDMFDNNSRRRDRDAPRPAGG